ncbi:MAG: methylated-DNA--[protein]-cysteine S-methyltransferase [Pyramidobacter sp.]|nr:methylated-DNA--[protein]-cysteine S-methyltransferase [Pyramidobacter sp.]
MYAKIGYRSPFGELTLAADERGLVALTIAGQKYEQEHLPATVQERETPVLAAARAWLDRYFAGENPLPDELPLVPRGTDFQSAVWRELTRIPSGETVTYGELAEKLRTSPRAVGAAVGRNPISIIVPCHRVVGKDGSLTGYAGGVEKKQWLLEHELVIKNL